jgi:hypothetical protein
LKRRARRIGGFTWSSQHLDLRSCGGHVVFGGS